MQIPPQHPSPEQLSLSLTVFSKKQKSTSWPLFQSDEDVPQIRYQVLRTQQRTQLHNNEALQPRKMARTKSPSQKIPRSNHNPIDMNKNEHPTIHIPSDQHLFETDENGNPKICFSYRTMQKQYEKDTLRMLERIQKSRSFELQQQQQQQQQPPNNNHQSICQRSSSLTEFATTNHETSQDYQLHYDSGFYIGDENDCNDHYHHDRVHDNQDWLEEEEDEEEEEIFELDL